MKRPQTLEKRWQAAARGLDPGHQLALEQPPYAAGFAEWLAYQFSRITASEVPTALAGYFPDPDQLDCDYLATVLQQIDQARYCEREVGCGVDFVFWGIEYSVPNVAGARQWLAARKATLDQSARQR